MRLTDDQYIRWFRIVASRMFKVSESSLCGTDRQQALLKTKKGVAGTKNGINDLLTMLQRGTQAQVSEIDSALKEAELPTVKAMVSVLHRKEAAILKRGSIRSDEEYYIAQELLSTNEGDLTPKQFAKLGRIASEYEMQKKA